FLVQLLIEQSEKEYRFLVQLLIEQSEKEYRFLVQLLIERLDKEDRFLLGVLQSHTRAQVFGLWRSFDGSSTLTHGRIIGRSSSMQPHGQTCSFADDGDRTRASLSPPFFNFRLS